MLGDRFEWSLMCALFLVFSQVQVRSCFLASAHRKESHYHTSRFWVSELFKFILFLHYSGRENLDLLFRNASIKKKEKW